MTSRFHHIESIYWVFTQRCNDQCAHCYNLSGPQGATMSLDDALLVVANLPQTVDRVILSGGEPFAEREKLYAILDALRAKYGEKTQIMLQTNGDLLTEERLDAVLERGVSRIDVASMDRYHKHQGERRAHLEALFKSRGLRDDLTEPLVGKDNYVQRSAATYGFWGANESFWIGGNWARGRALESGIWHRDGTHNFCAIVSGGRGFLGGTELLQEVSIQLYRVNPCCPGTVEALGDARVESIASMLERAAQDPAWQLINQGDPYALATLSGADRAHGVDRATELGNVCLWCDEYFRARARPSRDGLAPARSGDPD